MEFTVRNTSEKEMELFSPFNILRKSEIARNGTFTSNFDGSEFVLEFTAKIYIPGNVRADEHLPEPISYYVMCSHDRYYGMEGNMIIPATNDIQEVTFPSPTLYIPKICSDSRDAVVALSKRLLLENFNARRDRMNKSGPKGFKIALLNDVILSNPDFVYVDSIENL